MRFAQAGADPAGSDAADGYPGNKQAADEDWDASEDDERVANEAPVAQTLPVIKVHPRISQLTTEAQQMLIGAKGAVLSAWRRSGAADHPDGEGGTWSPDEDGAIESHQSGLHARHHVPSCTLGAI